MSETDRQLLEAAAKFGALAGQLINRTDVNDDYQTPEVEEILALIGKQSELRCFVDGTRNLGHQASTVAMAKRLVDLTRFAGRLVVVYADYRKDLLGCTAEKLALMFDGLDPSRIDECVSAYGSCRDIRFLDIARSGRLSNPIAFGFTGGADDMSVNYAAALNVRFFARIQPYLWDDDKSKKADPHYESSRIERSDGRHLYLVDACRDFQRLSFKFCRERVVVPDATWNWYADVQRFDAGLRVRTRNARALQEILRDCAEGGTERPLV